MEMKREEKVLRMVLEVLEYFFNRKICQLEKNREMGIGRGDSGKWMTLKMD